MKSISYIAVDLQSDQTESLIFFHMILIIWI